MEICNYLAAAAVVAALGLQALPPAHGLSGMDADRVRVNVLSLFKPERVIVSYEREVRASINNADSGGSSILRRREFAIKSREGGMLVNGAEAEMFIGPEGMDEFVIEIPDRFVRRYRGALTIRKSPAGPELRLVIAMPLEELVAASVMAEGGGSHEEAQRALAVVVRSFLLASKGRHGDGFDVCDTSHCAVFRGLDNEVELNETRRRIGPSSGAALTYKGRPVRAYFHAVCGGKTHTPEQVWGRKENFPYRSVICGYCVKARHYRWSAVISSSDMARALALAPGGGWELGAPNDGQVGIYAPGGDRTLSNERFRIIIGRALGWNILYSPWFTMQRMNGAYRFDGSGWGHGVGLCQAGADEMARTGKSWREILGFYFPGARLDANRGV